MSRSEELFARALERIPGGVNSPVRAFRSVGGKPLFIARGEGARIWDVDGREYIDYVGSWGPLLFGHRSPEVLAALEEVLKTGTSFGAPTEREVELAELICRMVPSIEKVRLVNSGTEATMAAIRLARGCSICSTLEWQRSLHFLHPHPSRPFTSARSFFRHPTESRAFPEIFCRQPNHLCRGTAPRQHSVTDQLQF